MKETNESTAIRKGAQLVDATLDVVNKTGAVKQILKYGKTPVFYARTKSMAKPVPEQGLTVLIAQAMTQKEVTNLLNKGKTEYKKASQKTIRGWESAANKRLGELTKK